MVDLDNPDQIRKYLKENMAEGYLSEEEGFNIDKFVDRYEQLLQLRDRTQKLVKQVQGVE